MQFSRRTWFVYFGIVVALSLMTIVLVVGPHGQWWFVVACAAVALISIGAVILGSQKLPKE